MVRNYYSVSMNREMIGYTIAQDFGPASEKEIKAYSDATLDDYSKYEEYGGPAPPFFFSRSLYPMFKKLMTLKGLNMNLLRMVHGRQGLICHAPVSGEDSLSVEMSIDDIKETPAGELLTIITRAYRKGSLVIEGNTGFMVRSMARSAPKKKIDKPDSGSDFSQSGDGVKISICTVKGQEKKYAKVSRDTNPIHTSDFFARLAGLPGTILHGVCVIAMCSNSLIDSLAGGNSERMRSVSARFSFPVIPGDTLTLTGKRKASTGIEEVIFDVSDSRGRNVVKSGYFSYLL